MSREADTTGRRGDPVGLPIDDPGVERLFNAPGSIGNETCICELPEACHPEPSFGRPTQVKEIRLTDEHMVFLRRTANILAATPWGAEHYRAQLAAIEEIERLRRADTDSHRARSNAGSLDRHPSAEEPLVDLPNPA